MDKQKLKKLTPFIIGGVLSIGLLIGGFMVMSGSFTRAADTEPRDVQVSNITENSATVSWSTGIDSQGMVQYGISSTALSSPAPETHKVKSHSVILSLLSKNTTYYFQIQISGKTYDNGGVPWTFTTKGATVQSSITPAPTIPVNPTPATKVIQRLNVPVTSTTCNRTNCDDIKALFGKGCTTQDYWNCVQRTAASNLH